MNSYLKATEHAVEELMRLIYEDSKIWEDLHNQLSKLVMKNEINSLSFERNELGDMKLTKDHPQHILDKSEIFENAINEIEELETQMEAKEHSIAVLSGAVLQIARQGLSSVHGEKALDKIPDIINIDGVPIQNIIWYGRNQALHFEESKPHPKTKDMFDILEYTYGTDIDLEDNKKKCLAKKILDILNWKTYDDYLKDMKALLIKKDLN